MVGFWIVMELESIGIVEECPLPGAPVSLSRFDAQQQQQMRRTQTAMMSRKAPTAIPMMAPSDRERELVAPVATGVTPPDWKEEVVVEVGLPTLAAEVTEEVETPAWCATVSAREPPCTEAEKAAVVVESPARKDVRVELRCASVPMTEVSKMAVTVTVKSMMAPEALP